MKSPSPKKQTVQTNSKTKKTSRTLQKIGISGGTGSALSGLALQLPDGNMKSVVLIASPLMTAVVAINEDRIAQIVNAFFDDMKENFELWRLTRRARINLKKLKKYDPDNTVIIEDAQRVLDACHIRGTELIDERLARK